MKNLMQKIKMSIVGMSLAVCAAIPAMADDIEIYTALSSGKTTIQPNIMFILDSSGSMNNEITQTLTPYDPAATYTGSCGTDRIYFTKGSLPDCASDPYFNATANKCDNSLREYINDPVTHVPTLTGNPGPLVTVGYFTGQIAQLSTSTSTGWSGKGGKKGGGGGTATTAWQAPNISSTTDRDKPIECYADRGVHGSTSSSSTKYIENITAGWTSTVTPDPHAIWGGGINNYTLYTSHYMNYRTGGTATTTSTRFAELKKSILALTSANVSINIGLMRFDSASSEGGAVMYPIEDINAARGDFQSRVKTMNASGFTPLAETYFEALRYFGGREVYYGNKASPSNQTGTTENGTGNKFYQTPITDTCQKNYIIYLTDGEPTKDTLSTAQLDTLSDFTGGSCAGTVSVANNCLVPLAGWALGNDVATRADVAAHAGDQHVRTYTIGFSLDAGTAGGAGAIDLLTRTAQAGDGKFFTVEDGATLTDVFNAIIAEVLAVNSTFSSPAVSVNAFNRATNLEDLYFTLFKPANGEHWEGNIKKFKLEFDANKLPFIADSLHKPAIDNVTGFFKDASVSYWTDAADAPDGAETAVGGAASHLTRTGNKYTFAGTYTNNLGVLVPSQGNLTDASNNLVVSNANITDAMLGGVAAYPDVNYYSSPGVVSTLPFREAMLQWARGLDIDDIDGDLNSMEDRREMGDPLHAEPGLVQYGLTAGGDSDLVAYVATNDGYLHAFNTLDGSEYFSFVPQEMLPKLQNIFDNTGATGKAYGLDGNVISWINDANHDGKISGAGEHVYLYFGMRRGGRNIYSMDVTDRNAPKLRWVIEGGSGDYAELADTWSAPNVEKINMGGTDRTVLIFGAGYDINQDTQTKRTVDGVGRGIFIVDAITGEMLWNAGPGGTADLQLPDMEYSIPARIKPIDIDGDGYVDRLYAGDMGGQIWRIDIDNKSNTSSSIAATGVRFADLALDNSTTENRRFYNPPDVALILEEGKAPYISVVAASGYRAHPLQTATHDRAYMIRDNEVYGAIDPATYTTLTEADLFDTTDNTIGEGIQTDIDLAKVALSGAKGWYITFSEMNGSFVGEKALSEPLILNGVAVFTTFIPASAGLATNSCTANDGTGAIYFVNVVDGTPTGDNNGDSTKTREDRRVLLARGGIPPTPRVIITKDGIPTLCVGTECTKSGEVGTVQKMYWYEVEE